MSKDLRPLPELSADRLDLLKEKLGKWFSWEQPGIVQTIGPFKPDVWGRFGELHDKVVVDCRDWLKARTDEDILIVVRNRHVRSPSIGQTDTRDPVAREWFSLAEGKIADLNRSLPPWYAGGFGHADHVADFEHWSRMPTFTVSELTCLSLGISPEDFPKLNDLCRSSDRPKFCSTLEFLLRRFEQLKRTFDPHDHGRRTSPTNFLEWVQQFELPVHPVFLQQIRRYHTNRIDIRDTVELKRPHRREIDSVAQLFAAMAIDQLGYRPRDPRSPIPKEIAELAASMGIAISDDTVRKYLKLGASFIPEDWEPNKEDR